MARSLTIASVGQRIAATICLLAFVTASIGHVAHNLDFGQKRAGKTASLYSASLGLCPTCVALHSLSVEQQYSGAQIQVAVPFPQPISYQGPAISGESLPFFVRPPPSV
jgi:hypothetical protein